jgi:hypothetical protein
MAESGDLSEVPPNLDTVRRRKAESRRVKALSLRMAGLTYAQVGEQLSISEEGARDLVERTLGPGDHTAADTMRELEGQRLDRAQAAIWTRVIAGDDKAIQTFLHLSQRRARLFGLDMPTKIDLSVSVRQEMETALIHLEALVLGEVTGAASHDVQPQRSIEPG